MLTITPTQWAVLGHQSHLTFEARALAFLREKYPEACAAIGDQLPRFLSSAIGLAHMSGLDSEVAVITICELALTYGSGFHRTCAWATHLLSASDADPDDRAPRLREYLP